MTITSYTLDLDKTSKSLDTINNQLDDAFARQDAQQSLLMSQLSMIDDMGKGIQATGGIQAHRGIQAFPTTTTLEELFGNE